MTLGQLLDADAQRTAEEFDAVVVSRIPGSSEVYWCDLLQSRSSTLERIKARRCRPEDAYRPGQLVKVGTLDASGVTIGAEWQIRTRSPMGRPSGDPLPSAPPAPRRRSSAALPFALWFGESGRLAGDRVVAARKDLTGGTASAAVGGGGASFLAFSQASVFARPTDADWFAAFDPATVERTLYQTGMPVDCYGLLFAGGALWEFKAVGAEAWFRQFSVVDGSELALYQMPSHAPHIGAPGSDLVAASGYLYAARPHIEAAGMVARCRMADGALDEFAIGNPVSLATDGTRVFVGRKPGISRVLGTVVEGSDLTIGGGPMVWVTDAGYTGGGYLLASGSVGGSPVIQKIDGSVLGSLPDGDAVLNQAPAPAGVQAIASDGVSVWVTHSVADLDGKYRVSQFRASDLTLLRREEPIAGGGPYRPVLCIL